MSCYKVDGYSPVYYARFKTLTCGGGRLVRTNSYKCKNTHKHTHTPPEWVGRKRLIYYPAHPDLNHNCVCTCLTPPPTFCNDSALGRDPFCQKSDSTIITYYLSNIHLLFPDTFLFPFSVSGRPAFDLTVVEAMASGVTTSRLYLTARRWIYSVRITPRGQRDMERKTNLFFSLCTFRCTIFLSSSVWPTLKGAVFVC